MPTTVTDIGFPTASDHDRKIVSDEAEDSVTFNVSKFSSVSVNIANPGGASYDLLGAVTSDATEVAASMIGGAHAFASEALSVALRFNKITLSWTGNAGTLTVFMAVRG